MIMHDKRICAVPGWEIAAAFPCSESLGQRIVVVKMDTDAWFPALEKNLDDNPSQSLAISDSHGAPDNNG